MNKDKPTLTFGEFLYLQEQINNIKKEVLDYLRTIKTQELSR